MLEDPFGWAEQKQERCYWRRVGFVAFVFLVIAIFATMLLFPRKANAALNYRAEGANGQVAGLRLSQEPCTSKKVLQHIKPSFHEKFKAAVLTYSGRDWQSCYIEVDVVDQNGREVTVIYSVDEEGAPFQPLPKSVFREDSI